MFESEGGYVDINHLEDHTSSIIAIKFAYNPKEADPNKRLKIISGGADKTVIYRYVNADLRITLYHKEGFKNNKLVSIVFMDTRVVAGHDKLLTVADMNHKVRVWEKKPQKIKA